MLVRWILHFLSTVVDDYLRDQRIAFLIFPSGAAGLTGNTENLELVLGIVKAVVLLWARPEVLPGAGGLLIFNAISAEVI